MSTSEMLGPKHSRTAKLIEHLGDLHTLTKLVRAENQVRRLRGLPTKRAKPVDVAKMNEYLGILRDGANALALINTTLVGIAEQSDDALVAIEQSPLGSDGEMKQLLGEMSGVLDGMHSIAEAGAVLHEYVDDAVAGISTIMEVDAKAEGKPSHGRLTMTKAVRQLSEAAGQLAALEAR